MTAQTATGQTPTGQTWLITGASRGLGRALVEAALDAGHSVFATVRDVENVELVDHENLRIHGLDVRDRGAAVQAVQAAVAEFGRLDVLVNNAGFGHIGAIEEASESDVRVAIDTNLLGAMWLSQAAIPVMREQGSGQIVQISTTGAVGAMPMLGLYNAAKWGLEGFSAAMAPEVAAFGIRVTIVEPGGLDTQWATGSMKFSDPNPAYDELRTAMFGTSEVPWAAEGTGGGTAPNDAAAAILDHVANVSDDRLRVMVGDDAPGQVAMALGHRQQDYVKDPRYVAAVEEMASSND